MLLPILKFDSNYKKLIIATGNSSTRQLAIYKNAGFERSEIIKNFFVEHYDEPIFENNIQCKHKLVLEMNL